MLGWVAQRHKEGRPRGRNDSRGATRPGVIGSPMTGPWFLTFKSKLASTETMFPAKLPMPQQAVRKTIRCPHSAANEVTGAMHKIVDRFLTEFVGARLGGFHKELVFCFAVRGFHGSVLCFCVGEAPL